MGKKRIIKIDPQNTTLLEDTSNRTIEIIVLLLCLFSLYIVIKMRKNNIPISSICKVNN